MTYDPNEEMNKVLLKALRRMDEMCDVMIDQKKKLEDLEKRIVELEK